jgi:hypothetical protein
LPSFSSFLGDCGALDSPEGGAAEKAAFFGRVQMKGSSVTKRVVDSRTSFFETPSLYISRKLLVLLCGGAIVTTHKEQRCSGENDTCAHLIGGHCVAATTSPRPLLCHRKNGEYILFPAMK